VVLTTEVGQSVVQVVLPEEAAQEAAPVKQAAQVVL
jgi:hypothetical protein